MPLLRRYLRSSESVHESIAWFSAAEKWCWTESSAAVEGGAGTISLTSVLMEVASTNPSSEWLRGHGVGAR